MSTTDTNCCPESPFTKKRRINKFGMFTDIPNPIPAEITDPDVIKTTFQDYPFIPYAGTEHSSAYGLLLWLNSMSHLSPTHGSCINSIKTYALGQPLDIVKKESSNFGIDTELTDAQKMSFADWIDSTVKFEYNTTLHKLVLNAYKNMKDNGNYFLEVTMSKFLGIPAVNMVLHNTENVCYVRPKPGKARFVGISHQWDIHYLKKYPPRILPVYPAVRDNGDSISTIIHIKEDTTRLYGRPDWINSFMPIYREFQNGNYLIKQAANNFMGQVLIEVEDAEGGGGSIFDDEDAQKSGFDNAAKQFAENFTAKSDDPQTAILLSRPFGAKEAFVYQFKPNTNETFYKVMSELNELSIIRAHQWSKRFLGENQTQGFSKDVFLDELKVKEAGVLPYTRSLACQGFNLAIDLMVNYFGKSEFNKYQITGKNNIDLLKTMMPAEDMTADLESDDTPQTPQE